MLDYGDHLQFEITGDSQIDLQTPVAGVASQDNLIVKAALALQSYTGSTKGCRIWLNKRLPMGGGLGGGSSNAATTLVALNHLWQTGLSLDKLAELGLALGADVPVFVQGRTAFATGVGEQLHPAPQPEHWYLVVNPGVQISTQSVFTHADLPRNTVPIRWHEYHFDTSRNDCQELVCRYHGEVAKLLHWLLEYAPSRMTGTGACVFAVFPDKDHAESVLRALPEQWQGFVAQGVNQSPLHSQLETRNG